MSAQTQLAPSEGPHPGRRLAPGSLDIPLTLSLLAHLVLLAVLVQWTASRRQPLAAQVAAVTMIELPAAAPRSAVAAVSVIKPVPSHASRKARPVRRLEAVAANAPAPRPAADAVSTAASSPVVAAPVVVAPPSTPAAAASDQGGIKTVAAPLPLAYLSEVSRIIQRNLNYPWQARHDGAKGIVVVHIVLARDGTVLAAEVVRSLHQPALDGEARDVVLRIHKFPGLPPDVISGDTQFGIDQPIGFGAG